MVAKTNLLLVLISLIASPQECTSIEEIVAEKEERLYSIQNLRRGISSIFEDKELEKNNSYSFEYTKGFRIPGDELLLSDSRFFTFPYQDVTLDMLYPKPTSNEKQQFLITAFKVMVSQDSPSSDGFLIAGGIRLDKVGLKIVASAATTFAYDIAIYGILHDLLSPDYVPEGIRPKDDSDDGDVQIISSNENRHV